MKKKDINMLTNRWLEAGAISQEQAIYITNDVEQYISETSGGKFITAVMYIGALALSAGVLLMIASNWSGFSNITRLTLAVLLPVVPLIFAYWQMVVKETDTVLARVANIFGVLLVGGAIALIEQTYHLQSSIQATLWMWIILTTPFVFVFKRVENVIFTAILAGTALGFLVIDYLWENARQIGDGNTVIIMTLYTLLYLAFLYSLGSVLRNSMTWLDSGRALRIGSGTLAVIVLFITTFEFYSRFITGEGYYSLNQGDAWILLTTFFNLLFIGFLVFAMLRAIKYEEYNFAFWVVRVAAFYLLVKYITLFYSMLNTGLFFIIGGIIFITGGRLIEKNKAKLVEYMRNSRNESNRSPFIPGNHDRTYE